MASGYPPNALNTPLPQSPLPENENAPFLDPPRASYRDNTETPRDSYAASTLISNNNSGLLLPAKNEPDEYHERRAPTKKKRRPLLIALIGLIILAVVVLAVVLPVYFTVIKPKQHNFAGSGSSGSETEPAGTGPIGEGKGEHNPSSPTGATSGGDGSTVIGEDGSTFTYNNKFGGFCKFSHLFLTITNANENKNFIILGHFDAQRLSGVLSLSTAPPIYIVSVRMCIRIR